MNDLVTVQPPPPPASSRRRTAWLVAGGILTVVALLVAVATLNSSIWDTVSPSPTVTDTEHQTFPPAARLDIGVPAGDISLAAGSPDVVDIERTIRWSGAEPSIAETHSGDTLRIVTDCPNRSGPCTVDQVVQAPPDIAADFRTEAGTIEVHDIDGALSLSTTAGEVTVADVAGPLSVQSMAGDVKGSGLRSPRVEVELTAGAVDLRFATAPEQVTVEVTSGSVTIEVPAGDPYRVQVETTVGSPRVEVVQDPGAERVIEVRAVAGDVHIRYAQ